MLALVFGTAAVLLLSAPALSAPPPWLTAEQTAIDGGNVQHSPALAIDPADPAHAVVTADDGTVLGPPAVPPPSTAYATTPNWTLGGWSAATPPVYAGGPAGAVSAGQADVAWGADATGEHDVYAVELGSATGGARNLCDSDAGIFFSTSTDGGATWGTPDSIDTGSVTSTSSSEVVEPVIATSGHHIYIAYTELRWAGMGCTGTPDSATIFLVSSDNDGDTWNLPPRRASPFALTGLYRSPALAVLPDGRVVVAFRDDSGSTPQIETETCMSPPATTVYCGSGSSQVGPSTVVGDATAPSLVSGMVGAAAPSVIAAGGRVVVAWHAAVDASVRAFAALSTDNGVSYGPAEQIDPGGAGSQVDPMLAATTGGRVDAAYLWDTGLGGVQAAVASANPPLAGASTEAWAEPVVVQSVPAASATGIGTQAAPLGRRLGVATADLPGTSPLPATVVAFTDTSGGGQDVHVTGLLHGVTAPTIAAQTVPASKNATTTVTVTGDDADGDPLTWSVGSQPSDPASSVSVADSSRGTFNFRAANKVGLETFEAVATDGVAGHETHGTVTVTVHNDPPQITCSVLSARENERLEIPVSSCVKDPNADPVTVTLDSAVNGSVANSDGTWYFDPAPQSTATGSFALHASDQDSTTTGKVLVTVSPPTGAVHLTVSGGNKLRTVTSGLALRFGAQAVDAAGRATPVLWSFGDHTPAVKGPAVAHRFRTPGHYTVTIKASTATATIPVVAEQRAVVLAGVPRTAGGVMTVRVRTRLAGSLSVRVDSRSQTVAVRAGAHVRTLRLQVTTGPLVRLTVRLTPKKGKGAKVLPALSVRRLVLVPPRSAG